MNEPLCRTCTHNVIVRHLMNGKPAESRACERRIRCFPDCTACRDYEREAGSD